MTESPLIQPLKREQRLYEKVADRILGLIKDGSWKPGRRLPTERELAEAFEVSRTVVREAVKVLEAQGILDVSGSSGIFVRQPDSEQVSHSLDLYLQLAHADDYLPRLAEIRGILEIEMAALAAQRANAEQKAALRTVCQKMRDLPPHQTGQLAELDFRFHLLLAEATQNEFFGVLLAPVMSQLHELYVRTWASYGSRPVELVLEMHEAVVSAIEEGDAQEARSAMRSHMSHSMTVMEEMLDGEA